MRFGELDINQKLLETARQLGFEELTPIQSRCAPEILKGKDVVGQAETGSGKTMAFAVPILDRISPGRGLQALVLTPTRELCVQVTGVFQDFGKAIGSMAISVYGGVGIEPQIRDIRRADVVVGTPGRILDHLGRGTIDFSHVRFLVLDETDRMLDMGFIDDVEDIIRKVPRERQTLMFSATIYEDVEAIMRRHLRNPVIVRTQSQVDKTKLRQFYYDIHYQSDKFSLLVHLLKNSTPGLALVFCATRQESDIVEQNLRKQGLNAMAIHGGMSQQKREESLEALKSQSADILVATDVAARGLDIKNVSHVYNYDVPKTAKEYIHRIGRTARAGEYGDAVTLLTSRDHDNFRRIIRDIESQLEIDEAEMPHFKRVPFVREPSGDRDRRPFGGRGGRRYPPGRRGRSGGRHGRSHRG